MVDEYPGLDDSAIRYLPFRFLYGRWIPLLSSQAFAWLNVQIPLWSMNTLGNRITTLRAKVQIPLWSMNTSWPAPDTGLSCRSDSSMVDEYS